MHIIVNPPNRCIITIVGCNFKVTVSIPKITCAITSKEVNLAKVIIEFIFLLIHRYVI